MATVRTRCISTKVTEEEYRLFTERAGVETVSAWARDALLKAPNAAPADLVLISELLALRVIVLTVQYTLARGESLTLEEIQRLIDRADAEKLFKAQQRLASSNPRRLA
jgi:hypothetical protein